MVKPLTTTQYFVNATDANGCKKKDTLQVTVLNKVELKWQYRLLGSCTDRPSLFVENETPPAADVTFRFDFGDGTTSEETEVQHEYIEDGFYRLKLTAQNKFCPTEDTAQLPVYTLFVPNVITPESSPGANDQFEIRFGPTLLKPADVGIPIQLTVSNRWGNEVFQSKDYKNDWNGNGLVGGVYYFQVKAGDFATCKSWLHIIK